VNLSLGEKLPFRNQNTAVNDLDRLANLPKPIWCVQHHLAGLPILKLGIGE
jgi:hypothetical protein